MKILKLGKLAAAVALTSAISVPAANATAEPTLSEADFEKGKTLYFQRCAGCHGVLRKGATGKSLEPKNTIKLGQKRLEKILTFGTEGGMNNFNDIFTKDEIKLMATYIQMTPPVPPEMSLALMQERTKVYVDPKDYPTKPMHDRNWENFFVVIERDAGKIAIIDGDKHEIYAHLDAGYAVHVIKGQEHHNIDKSDDVSGRFWYTIGRDGKLNKFDLWQTPDKML
ncbi:MAG: c-type cytochrome, partial [Thiotrichaceae bacterium]|nr:c-type cytochrome [Thiotrichaceae bacterium]